LLEENEITRHEYKNVIWGSIKESKMEHNKQFVTVFGKYTKKQIKH